MSDISPILDAFSQNRVLHFSILAFPGKKIKSESKNSKRVLLRGNEERMEWLKRQGDKNGFELIEAHETAEEQKVSASKTSGEFILSGVPFEGILRITDPALFKKGFAQGIGPEKAYGFGMLMLSKV